MKSNMFRFAFFVILIKALAVANSGVVTLRECETGEPLPVEIRIEGCEANKCALRKGTEVHAEIDFVANQDSGSVDYRVFARIGQDIMLPDIDNNGCHGLKPNCPLKKGEKYTLAPKQKLSKYLPTIGDTTLLLRLKGDGGSLACAQISASLD